MGSTGMYFVGCLDLRVLCKADAIQRFMISSHVNAHVLFSHRYVQPNR